MNIACRTVAFLLASANVAAAQSYDVAEDGRFIGAELLPQLQQPVTEMRLILNWFEELKQRVPGGR